ncbi:MAG: VCBS repeat-containing protein, partial [Pseudomonadota bacterium]
LTANGDFACADVAMFDADHDGDLDLFIVNANGPNELLSNNLDGTFRPLAEASGLVGNGGGRQLVTTDIDGDRDVDILVLGDDGENTLWLNDRLWQYRAADKLGAFASADIVAAVAGDVNADGQVELYAMDPAHAVSRWTPGDGWQVDAVLAAPASDAGREPTGTPQLALSDFDGDGHADLMVVNAEALSVHALDDAGATTPLFTEPGAFAAVVPWLWDVEQGPGLLGLKKGLGPSEPGPNAARLPAASAALTKWLPGPGRHRFVALNFTGKEDQADSMRSNRSGIGTHAALRVGSQWSLGSNFSAHSGPGQSVMPLSFGLGGAPRADYVAVNWSDGVFQTELNLEPGLTTIAETQRQLSSCPVLFAWNGERFAFVSDVLGVGGLGFMTAPGEVATPRPWEYFRLPDGAAVPRDGVLTFKLTEPMEEIAYLDSVSLHTIDVPPGWQVVLDERMGTGAPAPTGEPLFYREALLPTRAVNDRGQNVTDAVLVLDEVAAPVGDLDARFIGRVATPHALTLEFDRPLNAGDARPVLVADGWVEYPYSQTVFAAWQAGAHYVPPTLEARGADGQWRVVYAQFGYPAGMPREMALPLDALPEGTTALRLTTTLEVYWDRLRVVFAETPPDGVRRTKTGVASATLARTGFARRSNGPQRRPGYDYDQRTPYWDTRYPSGFYTATGDVTPLVSAIDDALAVFGPGEEVDFTFPAAPQEDGWTRAYVLEFRGWAKDMDLYTRDGGTVAPLPVRAPEGDATQTVRDALHERFNTRYESGN